MFKVYVIIGFVTFAYAIKIPPFLKACPKNDHKCALASANSALPGFFEGYKPFRMPPVDPFKFVKIDLSAGQGVKLFLRDGQVTNLKTLVIKDAKVEDDNKIWRFKATVDAIVDSDYEVGGKILVLPVQGKGKCHIELDNINIEFSMNVDTIQKKGKEYIKPTNDDLKMTVGDMRMQFDDLFNGDKRLGDQMNLFINENWQEVEKEFHQGIIDLILTIIRTSYIYIFENVPKEELVL